MSGFTLDSKGYMEYIRRVAEKIRQNKDYITQLDADIGDGDHWANIHMGFKKISECSEELALLPPADCFKRIGMLMLSVVGGSSGVLYGSAYIAAAKELAGCETIDGYKLCGIWDTMLQAIMSRGNAKPGFKTMIDALFPAVESYKSGLNQGKDMKDILVDVKKQAQGGVLSTRDMEAVRGRAYYQKNKGVGHIDPGAVTMSYQIEEMVDYLIERM